MNNITNNNFKSPVIGYDPISGGTFTIEYAYPIYVDDYLLAYFGESRDKLNFSGKIVINIHGFNPLYKIVKEQPLRLQGLIASVQFGTEKRFIKIKTISSYNEIEGLGQIELDPVTFEILDNLEYMENIIEYKDQNLL